MLRKLGDAIPSNALAPHCPAGVGIFERTLLLREYIRDVEFRPAHQLDRDYYWHRERGLKSKCDHCRTPLPRPGPVLTCNCLRTVK